MIINIFDIFTILMYINHAQRMDTLLKDKRSGSRARVLKLTSRFSGLKMAAVPSSCSYWSCSTLARYNNRDRFVSSSFIYKRSARPRSTVNFRKRYRTVRPFFHSAPASPVLPHQPLQPAYISTRKWIAIIKASLSFLPFCLHSYFLDWPALDLVAFLPSLASFLPIVFR